MLSSNDAADFLVQKILPATQALSTIGSAVTVEFLRGNASWRKGERRSAIIAEWSLRLIT